MASQRQLKVVPDVGAHQNIMIKVACATSDLKRINQHFGSAKSFAIYGISPEAIGLQEVVQFSTYSQDGNETKLLAKFEALEGCAAVYTQAIGASAIEQLRQLAVQPIKVPPESAITPLLQQLQRELVEGPSGWIARAIRTASSPDESRFQQMEAEGWEE